MLSGLQIGLLVAGVLLLIGTLPPVIAKLAGDRLPALARRMLRGACGIAGAALIVSVLASYAGPAARPAPDTGSAPVSASPAPAPALPATGAVSVPTDLVAAASDALEECAVATPPAVPDGATASLERMTLAQRAFKQYDEATVHYAACVDAVVDGMSAKFAGSASAADLARLKTFGISAHNSAIDREQALADQFNAQVRAYNARHPGPQRPRS